MLTKVCRVPSQSITQSFQRLIILQTPNSQYLVISSTRCVYAQPRGKRRGLWFAAFQWSLLLQSECQFGINVPNYDAFPRRRSTSANIAIPISLSASRRENTHLQKVIQGFCTIRKITAAFEDRFTFLYTSSYERFTLLVND